MNSEEMFKKILGEKFRKAYINHIQNINWFMSHTQGIYEKVATSKEDKEHLDSIIQMFNERNEAIKSTLPSEFWEEPRDEKGER